MLLRVMFFGFEVDGAGVEDFFGEDGEFFIVKVFVVGIFLCGSVVVNSLSKLLHIVQIITLILK